MSKSERFGACQKAQSSSSVERLKTSLTTWITSRHNGPPIRPSGNKKRIEHRMALTDAHIQWGWPLAAALLYVAIGPAVIAYRAWGLGVQRAGPTAASFFANLTPVFAAVLSALFLGEAPRLYHVLAFALIVAGILVSSRR